jgi:hypothetical protein
VPKSSVLFSELFKFQSFGLRNSEGLVTECSHTFKRNPDSVSIDVPIDMTGVSRVFCVTRASGWGTIQTDPSATDTQYSALNFGRVVWFEIPGNWPKDLKAGDIVTLQRELNV